MILKRKLIPGNEEKTLANTLANLPEKRVLIIASVDFSHHVREEFARLHDTKTIDTLNMGTLEDFANVEVDCRNYLAVARLTAIERERSHILISGLEQVSIHWSDQGQRSRIHPMFSEHFETLTEVLLNEFFSLQGTLIGLADLHRMRTKMRIISNK